MKTKSNQLTHVYILIVVSIFCAVMLAGCDLISRKVVLTGEELRAEQAKWFQDAKFGMFIHWGVYSVAGRGEWLMNNEKLSIETYEKLTERFNPIEYDPAEWVQIAKDAGMKYITITSKHHDGFAMWDSKVTKWDIVDTTPYGKDVLKMLADECEKQNMPLFFYHSHLDWHHPDYFPLGQTGHHSGREQKGDFNKYIKYMNKQIAELCSGRYGKLAGFWFDGWWDQQVKKPGRQTHVDWRLQETYDLIHRLQPQALIGNNHHEAPFPGEDFQMFERGVPGRDKYSKANFVSKLPLETCDTINNSWGYNRTDRKFKSPKQLIRYLVMTAGYNANLLLNVGPMPNGQIQTEAVRCLKEVGKWLSINGETIYGTRGGPMPPQNWGVTTKKGDKIYVHIFQVPENGRVALPNTKKLKVKSAKLFKDASEIEFNDKGNVVLRIPRNAIDPNDTIVVLEI